MRQWQNIFRSLQLPSFVNGRENLMADHAVNTEEAKWMVWAGGRGGSRPRGFTGCGCLSPGVPTALRSLVSTLFSEIILSPSGQLKVHLLFTKLQAGGWPGACWLGGEVRESWGPRKDMMVFQPHMRRQPVRFHHKGSLCSRARMQLPAGGETPQGAVAGLKAAPLESVHLCPLARWPRWCHQSSAHRYLALDLFTITNCSLVSLCPHVILHVLGRLAESMGPTLILVADLPPMEARPPHAPSGSSVCGRALPQTPISTVLPSFWALSASWRVTESPYLVCISLVRSMPWICYLHFPPCDLCLYLCPSS